MFQDLFTIDCDSPIVNIDKRERYKAKAHANAKHNIGPWLSVTILGDTAKRAKNNNFEFNLDRAYLVSLWNTQNGRCAVSDMEMDTHSGTRENKNPMRGSLDRIDNSKGYVRGNVRFVCHWVNNAKSTWTDEIFEQFIKACGNKYINENINK